MFSDVNDYNCLLVEHLEEASLVNLKLLKKNLIINNKPIWTQQEDEKLNKWVKDKGIDEWEKCSYLFSDKSPLM